MQILLDLPACTHLNLTMPAYVHALYVKGGVRTPVMVKMHKLYFKKVTCGQI